MDKKLSEKGCWSAPLKTHKQVYDDPQVKHMNMFTTFYHNNYGEVKTVSPAVKMSETPIEDSQNVPLNIHDVLDTENNSINSDIETMEEIKTSIQDEIINISNNNEKDETIEIQELSVN